MEEGTPFRYNDYGSALRRLDELLGKWKAATHASERQAATEQALSNLICYAAEEFQEATGEAPGPANRLRPFLQCILKALPDRTTKYHGVRERDEEGVLPQALQKRVSRQLVRSQRAMQRKPQRAT
jgi:hypothetical protein